MVFTLANRCGTAGYQKSPLCCMIWAYNTGIVYLYNTHVESSLSGQLLTHVSCWFRCRRECRPQSLQLSRLDRGPWTATSATDHVTHSRLLLLRHRDVITRDVIVVIIWRQVTTVIIVSSLLTDRLVWNIQPTKQPSVQSDTVRDIKLIANTYPCFRSFCSNSLANANGKYKLVFTCT